MTNIVVNDEYPETTNLIIKCLKTAGFEVSNLENGLVYVQLAEDKLSTNIEMKQANTYQSIFPSIFRLREVFEFIELNYHQNIKLKDVAQAVGYSSAYLTDLVRRLTGKTVNNWIIERRIVETRHLLLETEDSIEQIALIVGYQNLNHFYHQFRNYCQNTPRAWREAQRCKQSYNSIKHNKINIV